MKRSRLLVLIALWCASVLVGCDEPPGQTGTHDTSESETGEGDVTTDQDVTAEDATETDASQAEDATTEDVTEPSDVTDTAEDVTAEDTPAADATSVADADVTTQSDVEPDATVDATEPDVEEDTSEPCVGVLCGGACCSDTEECVAGHCLEACPSQVRCGGGASVLFSVCCEEGEVCANETCVTPVIACEDAFDCPEDHFCELQSKRCLPNADVCEAPPADEPLTTNLEWSYTGGEIIAIPVVADINGDGKTELVASVFEFSTAGLPDSALVAFDGATGNELWRIDSPAEATPNPSASMAVGDVDGDGLPDIVYAGRKSASGDRPGLVMAVDGTGAPIWTAHDSEGQPVLLTVVNGGATLANFDDDPMAEVVYGATLIDHDGLVLWNEGGNGAALGSNDGYTGGISAVADLDGDGAPEIISGHDAWTVDWPAGGTPTVTSLWTHGTDDGYPAVADLDGDGSPEVILVARRTVRVLKPDTGELWCEQGCTGGAATTQPLTLPGDRFFNRGGPPTIADFDGDGRPEIGIAGGTYYMVIDLHRDSEDLTGVTTNPARGELFVRWRSEVQDASSNASGSSVFDFLGDGEAEVVYMDECYLRVYSGPDGAVELELANSSGTVHEYPLVVDVDDDEQAELVVVANAPPWLDCGEGYTTRRGLYVYGGGARGWVPTRKVWNQHAYHITNIKSDGTVPETERASWTADGVNSYRQNTQGEGLHNAPDLGVELASSTLTCPEGVTLLARVFNQGTTNITQDIIAQVFEGDAATGTLIHTETRTEPLPPGGSYTFFLGDVTEGVTHTLVVDLVDDIIECDETNNSASIVLATCP